MKSQFAPWATADRPGAITLRSADGALSVSLHRSARGVCVQRAFHRPGAARALQSARFTTASAFRQWCEAGTLRFDDPLMFNRLVRHADVLFDVPKHKPVSG